MKHAELRSRYPMLTRALREFDSNAGFSYQEIDSAQQRMLAEPGRLSGIRTELTAALADTATPWPDLLVNDGYEAGDELGSDEARHELLRLLWDALYPELPPRLPDAYRVIEVSEGGDTRIAVERASDGAEVARVLRIARQAETLVVDYELLDTGLLPAVLRKHLRKGICSLLAGNSMLEGVRKIECVNPKQGSRAELPFNCERETRAL